MDTNITRALGGQLDAIKETLKAIKTDTFSADQKRTVKQVVRNDADNLYAQGLYARYLMHAQSYKKAIPLLQRVARQNCDSNQKKALRFIKGAALCSLGYCHQNGHELEQSYEEAVRYYLLAENEGHALAQYNLGVMYHSGQHVEQNFQKAFEYFSLAAKQECSYSQYNLGVMYDKGVYVEQDLKKAFEWYSLAAKQEYPYSQYNLGVMYTKGIYVKQDLEKAFEWYSLAAKQGDAKAQYNLGNMYYHGRHVQKNYEKAFEFYSSAAEQGLASAQCNLGGLYYRGEYVGENNQKAFEWYSLAAEQGHAKAQSNLASMYYLGFHVTQNFQKVFELYSLAAVQGNATSLYNLGGMYKNGYHVTKDLRKAFKHYTQALVRAPQLTTLFSKTFSKDIDSLPTLEALEILQYMTLVLTEHARTKTLSEEDARTIAELLNTVRGKASAISENAEEKDKEYKDYLMSVIEHGLDFLKYYKGPISYIISDPIWGTLHTILDSTQDDKVNHFYFDLGLKILGSSLEEVQSKQSSEASEETLGEKAIRFVNTIWEHIPENSVWAIAVDGHKAQDYFYEQYPEAAAFDMLKEKFWEKPWDILFNETPWLALLRISNTKEGTSSISSEEIKHAKECVQEIELAAFEEIKDILASITKRYELFKAAGKTPIEADMAYNFASRILEKYPEAIQEQEQPIR